ncbi:MAG TPA: hypothetical protein VFR55_01970 [Dehalococcoidia bacterium]|nr:hypothetical protein [Dehalococcoidia bacterium]
MRSVSSKWLLGGGLVILALIISSVVVGLLSRSQTITLLPEATPGGTVQRYLLAIENGETRQAYDYFSADLQERCTFEYFRDTARGYNRIDSNDARDTRISLESERLVDNATEVQIRITESYVSAPFDVNEYSHSEVFLLEQLDGDWKLVDEPWPIYGCPEPVKPR